jgi:hypothetical protein
MGANVVSELLWILVGLVAIMAASVATALLILRAVYRRIRHSRTLGGAVLRTRAGLSHGPQRKVLQLRVQLGETLDSGRAAVEISNRGGWPRGELPRLFRRIESVGLVLDSQLRLMESETQSAVLTEELPIARERVDEVTALVRRLRSAVASGLSGPTDGTLAVLRSDVDREVTALQAGLQELQALYARDGIDEPARRSTADRLDQPR